MYSDGSARSKHDEHYIDGDNEDKYTEENSGHFCTGIRKRQFPGFHVFDDSSNKESLLNTETKCKGANNDKNFFSKCHRRSASHSGDYFVFAHELGEVATRAVEQAEELVIHLWKKGWEVVHHHSLPHWLRDNDYLLRGHRPQLPTFRECFRSIFRVHTETGNIWTHLIGEILC